MRRHLTYSNVVATLALVLALGAGTVYAASKLNGKTVKKNSLPGNRVKKGTLTGDRFKANTIKGGKIDESSLGTVPRSQTADSAGSAYEVFQSPDPVTLPFRGTNNQLVRIQLPIGKYAINGKVVLHNNGPTNITGQVTCSLLAGAGYSDISKNTDIPIGADVTFNMQTVSYLPAAGPVTVECNPQNNVVSDQLSATQGKIMALTVADVVFGPSAPIPPSFTG